MLLLLRAKAWEMPGQTFLGCNVQVRMCTCVLCLLFPIQAEQIGAQLPAESVPQLLLCQPWWQTVATAVC